MKLRAIISRDAATNDGRTRRRILRATLVVRLSEPAAVAGISAILIVLNRH